MDDRIDSICSVFFPHHNAFFIDLCVFMPLRQNIFDCYDIFFEIISFNHYI